MKKFSLLALTFLAFQKINAQVPCSGTPGAATVMATGSTVCMNGAITLTPDNMTFGTGLTFLWHFHQLRPWAFHSYSKCY